jgi:hypothetical protein
MFEIIATDEQAKALAAASFPIVLGQVVPVRDPDFTDDEIREAKRRAKSPGRRFTTAEVLAHLRSSAPE